MRCRPMWSLCRPQDPRWAFAVRRGRDKEGKKSNPHWQTSFPVSGDIADDDDDYDVRVCVNAQVRQNFNDFVAIITADSHTGAILFDGQSVTAFTQWTPTAWDYSYAVFAIFHGVHYITVTTDEARFAAYVYGHSIIDTSSSAYGFAATYRSRIMLLTVCFRYVFYSLVVVIAIRHSTLAT